MNKIKYIKGDATNLVFGGNKIIVHICNDIGVWGAGFVLAISKRWKLPEKEYKSWFNSKINFSLGEVQFVQVEKSFWVANLIGQHDIVPDEANNPPIRYWAVSKGLEKISKFAIEKNAGIQMPRIGCGLAGGTWEKIEPLIQEHIINKNISVIVYDF